MEALKINEIVKAISGNLINFSEDITIKGVTASLMSIRSGFLFIPLVNDDVDPAPQVQEALKRGASAIVVTKEMQCKIPQIIVNKPKEAYRGIAAYYRKKFNIPLIAVTGSYGKTSTKDLIANVLDERFNVHKTKRNFNGLVGMPATIMQLNSGHEISVVEMGMEAYGHIQMMADIARPSIAVITNIGTAHIGNFGKREYIMKAKMEVASYFDKNDILIINSDDKYLSTLTDKPYRIIKVSTQGTGDYNAFDIVNMGEQGVEFKCNYKGKNQTFKINASGIHNVYNAMFAVVIGDLFGLSAEEVKTGILKFIPEDLRMNVITTKNKIKLILDCYTAEPDTVKAAVDVLDSFNGSRKIAVLGGMFGQGSQTEKVHREIGKYIINKCNLLLTVGKQSKYIYEEAKNSMESKHFETKEELSEYIKIIAKQGDIILINGGRMAELETVGTYLVNLWNS